MAEVLPASFPRRWTIDAPPRHRTGLLPKRIRVALLLAAVTLILAGASLGMLAWWKPIQKPALIVLASAPAGTVNAERTLAVRADGAALANIIRPNTHLLVSDSAPTRSELLRYVNMIRLAKPHDYIVLLVSAAAGVSPAGEVVLFTSDAGPANAENALRLHELTDAISQCRAEGLLVLLDLVPADDATLTVVPTSDLAARVDATLRAANLGRAAIVTSHAPTEQSHLVPIGDRTLFGWLCDQALQGTADGRIDGLCDGRITCAEFMAYLQQELPTEALQTTGQPQHPCVYGTTSTFDVAVVGSTVAKRPVTTEYPKWLMEAWARWQTVRQDLNDQTAIAWGRTLRTAELIVMSSGPESEIERIRAELATYAPVAPQSGTTSRDLSTTIEQYLDARRDALASTPPAQAKGAEQKLLAAFTKAHASASTETLSSAIMTVAASKAHASVDDWQALLALADMRPGPTTIDSVRPLRSLYDVRQACGQDAIVAEAARLSLQVAVESEVLTNQQQTWPWLRTLIDEMLDNRVHGDALLFAIGYANPQAALEALQQSHESAQQLRQAAAAIEAIMAARHQDRTFVRDHAYLATQDPGLADAWTQSVQALHRLDTLLLTPPTPVPTQTALRTLVRDLSAAAATVDASLAVLRNRVSSVEVSNAITACRQSDADVTDLSRARLLIQSNDLAPANRRDLWLAYVPLANKLQAAVHMAGTLTTEAEPTIAAVHARRVAMHDTWQACQKQIVAPTEATASIAIWRDDWRRYHQDELARVTASGAPPVWSSAALEIVGPFACEAIQPDHPAARFELAWQQRRMDAPPPTVSAVSPSDVLAVDVESVTPAANQPARFRLRLRGSAEYPFHGCGFLAVFASSGRRYHAPIALPGAKNNQAVCILLSSSPTQLELLERIPLLGGNSAVYVWLENNTSEAQQVTVTWGNAAPSPPVVLAAHEIRCGVLAPPTTTTTTSEVVVRVQDVATQKQVAERSFPFYSPDIGEVVHVRSARVSYDPMQGATLTVDAALNGSVTNPLTIGLVPGGGQPTRPLAIRGGTTRMALTPEHRSGALTAGIETLITGESLRCEVFADGIAQPLVLTGNFPASGDTANLFPLYTPQVTIAGDAVAQPAPNYTLAITASNSLPQNNIAITLHAASDNATVLTRQVPAAAAPVATLAATNPPGGLLLHPVTTAPVQIFDTSGLVGRFVWRATLVADGKTIATGEQPVVFDNTAPASCRFVRPTSLATKESVLTMQVAGWDDLTDIVSVQMFLGKPIDNKAPPGVRMFAAAKSLDDSAVWSAAVTMPKDLGPCDITALLTNGVGLTTAITATVDVLDVLPLVEGNIHGVVVEGSLPQANLDVALEKAPGAAMQTVKTDEQGRFDFHGVAVGTYTVRSTKASSQRKGAAEVKVDADHTATATIRLAL